MSIKLLATVHSNGRFLGGWIDDAPRDRVYVPLTRGTQGDTYLRISKPGYHAFTTIITHNTPAHIPLSQYDHPLLACLLTSPFTPAMFKLAGLRGRSLSIRLVALLFTAVGLHLLLTTFFYDVAPLRYSLFRGPRGSCPPDAWAAGRWVAQPPPTNRTHMNTTTEAFEFLGLEGCASNRELWWHLGADAERLFDRFPGVASWRWEPPRACDIQDLGAAALVKHLVEDGGWMLVGGESFQS